MEKIAISGAGGFSREVLNIIQAINKIKTKFDFIGYIDKENNGSLINGMPIIGNDEEINQTTEPISIVIAVGEPWLKRKIRDKYTNPLIKFPTLIHPSVIIGDEKYVKIGDGCIICAGSILTTNITIQDFVTLNLMCTVGHDTIIKDFSSFMPSVNISGEVVIDENVYVGTGAKIINQLRIGSHTIVGAGAVVSKNLPANCTAVGVPAKPIKFREI